MGYQVLRVEKLKSAAQLLGRLHHSMRELAPAHADPARTKDNTYWTPSDTNEFQELTRLAPEKRTRAAMARFRALLPPTFRKDAVQALEVVVTASSEALEAMRKRVVRYTDGTQLAAPIAYLAQASKWLTDRFGGKGNLVATVLHRDETADHIHLFYVPRIQKERALTVDGHTTKETYWGLSAKHFLGGPKELAQLQTDFHEAVAKQFKLERGRHHSPARHMTMKKYHSIASEVAKEIEQKQEKDRLERRKDRTPGW